MPEHLILLDAKKVKKLMRYKKVPIELFESIDSTSDYLKSFIVENQVRVCVAETQTLGRGRFNRPWHSPFGQNVYLSLLYPFEKDLTELRGLSVAISLLIAEAIEQSFHIPEPLQLKWPNDLYCQNAKLGGCLIEFQAESNGFCTMILGVGINVNMLTDIDNNVCGPWTSICKINKLNNDRNILCANIINHLLDNLQIFSATTLKNYLQQWRNRDYLFNKIIKVKSYSNTVQGKMLGLDAVGNLQLKPKDAGTKIFSSGDTTLLKKFD